MRINDTSVKFGHTEGEHKSSTNNLTLLSRIKFLVVDFYKLCVLFRLSKLYTERQVF